MEPLESFAHQWKEMEARVARLERELAERPAVETPLPSRPLRTREFSQEFPEWTEGRLRTRLFHRKTNGLVKAGAVVENPDGIYILPESFFAWLAGQPKKTRRR